MTPIPNEKPSFSSFRGISSEFIEKWGNPDGFYEKHLRVPYRFKKEDYTEEQMQTMRDALNEMSGQLDGCIEFYDDTE